VTGVAFADGGKALVSASEDGTPKVWDARTRELKATLKGHDRGINAVAVSPDGSVVASGSDDRTVRLWDPRTGKLLKTLEKEGVGSVRSVAFAPDGKTVASANFEPSVRLWDVKTGELRKSLFEPSNGNWSVVFAPDGETLWCASAGGWATLWDVRTGEAKRKIDGPGGNYQRLALTPDGGLLASGKGTWDTRTGLMQRKEGASAFSADGKWAASVGKMIVLRDAKTWAIEYKFAGHAEPVTSVAFAPDGKTLATGSRDKTVKLWRVD
jgi:WD40 repeat protein